MKLFKPRKNTSSKILLRLIQVLLVLIFLLLTIYIYFRVVEYEFQIKPLITSSKTNKIKFQANRFIDYPIIDSTHNFKDNEKIEIGFENISFPTLITVPDWIQNPLGKYYLYYSHHVGKSIKMAYSNSLEGPWKRYGGDVLPIYRSGLVIYEENISSAFDLFSYCSLSEMIALNSTINQNKKDFENQNDSRLLYKPNRPHIASPEIYIDNKNQVIRMYYHGIVSGSIQKTKIALSKDGLLFIPTTETSIQSYARIFKHKEYFYALSSPGLLYRSKNGLKNFENRKRWLLDEKTRHNSVLLVDEKLYIFYSRVGDAPERILYTSVDLNSDDWNKWSIGPSFELIKPEKNWEGFGLKISPSLRGEIPFPVNQLRDPYVFKDKSENFFLIYTAAGENSIGIVELKQKNYE